MTRVSENSSSAALNYALNRAKGKLEDLQLKGSTLKKIRRPSDNPVANVEALGLSSVKVDNTQYLKNANYALLQLTTTEKAIEQLTDIIVKAKELAIAQASDFYNGEVRRNVSNEVIQMRNQVLAVANTRVGNRYIFGGHSTLKTPFNIHGEYFGDKGEINLEVAKDFFVPVNLNGSEVFYIADGPSELNHPLNKFDEIKSIPKATGPRQDSDEIPKGEGRSIASVDNPENPGFAKRDNIFAQLTNFIVALDNNDADLVQDLLEKFDSSLNRLITLRTKVGSIYNSVQSAQSTIESNNIDNEARKSYLIDADIGELFAELTKQEQVLKTTYKAGSNIMNQTLLDFLR